MIPLHAPPQNPEVRSVPPLPSFSSNSREFARRYRTMVALAVACAIVVLLAVPFTGQPLLAIIILSATVLILGAGAVLMRCPACNGSLYGAWNLRHCPTCGAYLGGGSGGFAAWCDEDRTIRNL